MLILILTEEQIIGSLRQAEAAFPIKEVCRSCWITDVALYKW